MRDARLSGENLASRKPCGGRACPVREIAKKRLREAPDIPTAPRTSRLGRGSAPILLPMEQDDGLLKDLCSFEQRVADASAAEMRRERGFTKAIGAIAAQRLVPFEPEDNDVRSDELLSWIEFECLRPIVVDAVARVAEGWDQTAVRE